VRVQPAADGEDEPLADPRTEVVVCERENRADDEESQVDERDPAERAHVGGNERLVDEKFEEPDLRRLDRRHGDEHEDAGRERDAEGPRERPEAAKEHPHRHVRRRRDDAVAAARWREQAAQESGRSPRAGAPPSGEAPVGAPGGNAHACLGVGAAPAAAADAPAAPAAPRAAVRVPLGRRERRDRVGDLHLHASLVDDGGQCVAAL
jgi:hypothetical protein